MRLILTLIIGLFAGAAMATTYDQAGSVIRKIEEYKKLKAMQALQAADIGNVSCRAGNRTGIRAELKAGPNDTGWAGLLSALNTVLDAKATAAKAELEALGVTDVP